MRLLLVLVVLAASGCAASHELADAGVDAGCSITWPCVGTACPADDLREGLYFPCGGGEGGR